MATVAFMNSVLEYTPIKSNARSFIVEPQHGSSGLARASQMLFEPGTGQLQQLWCRLQVDLGAKEVLMAQIG
ncbi:hypothetical protein [Mesorhizobium loti]|nr:hypothetical protein [Mesorhizobium loti]